MKGHGASVLTDHQSVLDKNESVRNLYGDRSGGVVSLLKLFYQRMRTRRVLRHLTDAELKDVGLSRAQALREAWRPFWL